jgi:hypothetical protein
MDLTPSCIIHENTRKFRAELVLQDLSWRSQVVSATAAEKICQGKGKAANDLLAPIYNWFTKGFDTADLQDAKTLLTELET